MTYRHLKLAAALMLALVVISVAFGDVMPEKLGVFLAAVAAVIAVLLLIFAPRFEP